MIKVGVFCRFEHDTRCQAVLLPRTLPEDGARHFRAVQNTSILLSKFYVQLKAVRGFVIHGLFLTLMAPLGRNTLHLITPWVCNYERLLAEEGLAYLWGGDSGEDIKPDESVVLSASSKFVRNIRFLQVIRLVGMAVLPWTTVVLLVCRLGIHSNTATNDVCMTRPRYKGERYHDAVSSHSPGRFPTSTISSDEYVQVT